MEVAWDDPQVRSTGKETIRETAYRGGGLGGGSRKQLCKHVLGAALDSSKNTELRQGAKGLKEGE